MKFRSSLLAQASGSLAGSTFSHNKGGQYIRNRATPVNPNTPQQIAVRAGFAQLAALWSNTLTPAQRAGWDNYATLVSVFNVLGNTIFLTGFNMYIRSNCPRVQAGLARVDDAPTDFTLGSFTPITMTATAALDGLSITFDNTDDWANETGAFMFLYGSRSVQPSINFFKGPFRLVGQIVGDDTTAPTSPASFANVFTNVAGNKVFARVRVSRADGRLSNDQIVSAIVT